MKNLINKLKNLMNIKLITKILLIFILLQPVFDILSYLNIHNYIPIGISTVLKPLFVFGLGILIFIADKEQRKNYSKIFISYGILMVIHNCILKEIMVSNSVILHEIRFMINIAYMLVLYMIMDYVYVKNNDKEKFIKDLKKVLILTFLFYCVTIIIAIITGTSGKTYEYSDASKLGYKGWLDSGQIFGHALSITLPFLIYYLLNKSFKRKYLNVISKAATILPIAILLLIGTKVTYFIALLVLFTHIVLNFVYFIKEKNKKKLLSSIICLFFIVIAVASYKQLPVRKNIEINNAVLSVDMSANAEGSETKRPDLNAMKQIISECKETSLFQRIQLKRISQYYEWDLEASKLLEQKYANGELHPSNMRAKQLAYNTSKYRLSSLRYKLFGLGYLNQPETLSIERDIFMMLFSFGLLGLIIVLSKPIYLWIYSLIKILKNIKNIKLETLYLFEGFSIFFCISIYAGYTYIYTNFSIFLVVISLLLKDSLKEYRNKNTDSYFEKVYNKGRISFYEELEENLINNKKQFIITANPETIMQMEKNEELKKAYLDKNTVVIPDGIGIIKGAKMLNYNIKETILGIDVAYKLLELGDKNNKKIFLFGSKEEVIEKMQEVLKQKYPNCELVGAINGYVNDRDKVFEQIKKSDADIVLVALGIPSQEVLIYKHLNDFNKGIFVGVGGSFDVISGSKKRAPQFFIKFKLEWLYRITTEPKRLKRFFDSNIKYLLKLGIEK